MKIKNITTLFILICSLIVLTVTGCKNVNNSDNSKTTEKTGSITGKAFYSNAQDNSTIQVTLDKTDGLRSAAVLNEAGMYNPDCYEITSSNLRNARTIVSYTPCSEDGSYSFTNLEPGVYTVYAMSQDSKEKAVSRNISVVVDGEVVVPDLQLTATGSLSGKITLDNSEVNNSGFVVFIAGTSYMAVTGTDGLFTITDIPAKADYQIIVMYGTYTYLWKTSVEVKAFNTVSLGEIDFDSEDVLSGIKGKDGKDGIDGQNGKDGQDGADGAKGDKGDKGDKGEDGKDTAQYTIRTTEITPCEDYPDGGIKLEVLKNGIVQETRYISNGAAGTDADQYTIRTTAVEPGDTNLPNGGIKLEVIKNNETVVDTKYISKGDKGDQGDRGEEGYHLVWKGSFASSNQILNPQYLWGYYNSTEGCSYIYNGQEWELLTINNDYEDLSIYSVRHLLQNLNDDNYTLAETEQKIGRIGRTTSESPKEYEGFEATPIVQKTVTSDGNTVVEIKYDRKISTIFFDTGDGPALDSITAKFGAPVTAPYYDSIRMEENGEAFYIDRFEPAVPSTMPAESVTCVALWKNIVDLYSNYTVYLYPEPYTVDTLEMFELTYEKGQTLQLPEYDSEHYDFCGWYPEEKVTFNVDEYNIYNINTFSGEPFTEISPDTWLPEWNEYSIIILYAKLEPKQYTITYHNFDSGNDSSYPKTYYYEEYPYIETPERQDNKFFGGWFLDEDFIQRIDFSGHLCTPDTVHTGIGPYDSETVNRHNFNLLNYYGLLGSVLLTYGNNYLLYFLTTTSSTHFDGNIDLYAKWNDANEVSVYVNELGSLWSLQSEEFPLTVKLLDDVIDWEDVVKRFKFDYDYGIYRNRNLTDYIILDLSNTTLTEVPSFKDCDLLYGIILPDTVTNIGSSSFHHCSSLTTVYYTGTEEQWNTITIGSENTPLTDATIVYNYTPPQE